MSLKAKLEAVIYAAEEPVTLAQMSTLFAEEALLWKARQDELLAPSLPLADSEADAPAAIELAESGLASGAELTEHLVTPAAESVPQPVAETALAETALAEPALAETAVSASLDRELPASEETDQSPPPVRIDADSETSPETTLDAHLEIKRLEHKRDKDVRDILRSILDELIAEYADDSRGLEIREIAGGFRMGTKPEIHDAVRSFIKSLKPPMKLSLPALETLAVIAYKQPVTAPEVGDIRGVDSAGVLGSLISRKLITTAGRKQVIGRPMLYKTTREFLLRFGLKDVNELPSMEEFEKMAAIELSEGEDDDASDATEQTGDLFAEAVPETVFEARSATEPQAESNLEPTHAIEVSGADAEAVETIPTPTAESSSEAAAEQALVERQNADAIEVQS